MNTLFKRASATLAGGALAFSGLALASTAPAAAATPTTFGTSGASVSAAAVTPQRPVDVTRIRAVGGAITYSTKGVDIAASGSFHPGISYFSMTAGVYRGSKRIGSVYLSSSNGKGYLSFRSGWGRGTFRIANVHVSGSMNSSYNYAKFNYNDAALGGAFSIKSGLKASGKVKYWYGSSKKVATIKLKRYNPSGWKNYKTKVKLQRKSHGWKTIKKLKLNRKGKAKYTFRSSKKYKYRFVVKATSTTAGGKFTTYSKA